MTPAEIYTIIRNQCAETATDFWSEAEVYSLMSTAEKQIAQRIGNIEASTALTTTTGTKTYTVSGVSGVFTRVTYDSYRLKGITVNQMDDVEGQAYGGVTLSGPPVYYYRYGSDIGLSPTPDASHTVSIYYNKTPGTVTTASSHFTVPEEYCEYIPDYCLYRMMLKDQMLQQEALIYKNQWDENIKIINNHYNQKKYRDALPSVVINDPLVEF
jgi:hypothetical protein